MPPDDLSGDFILDPERSRIGFTARHAVITKVRGRFGDFSGSAFLDDADPSSSAVEVTIQTVSIDTGNAARDGELRTNAFLDAPSYPDISFVATDIDEIGGRQYDVTGDLTIKATTLPITVRFELVGVAEDENGRTALTFNGTGHLNRRDWQVEWPPPLETGGVLVGDRIGLEMSVVAVRAE